eukprot:675343_1
MGLELTHTSESFEALKEFKSVDRPGTSGQHGVFISEDEEKSCRCRLLQAQQWPYQGELLSRRIHGAPATPLQGPRVDSVAGHSAVRGRGYSRRLEGQRIDR